MAPLIQAPSLLNSSLEGCRILIKEECLRISLNVVENFVVDEIEEEETDFSHEEREIKSAWRREKYLKNAVETLKDYFLSHIPWTLLRGQGDVFGAILGGIEDALNAKKRLWTPATNMTRFTREMYAIVAVSSLLVVPNRNFLDFDSFPKIIRSKMYERLGEFIECRTLILGSGSGGWVTEAYADKFLLGIPHLKNLVHFSLKYDCTINILQVLSETCRKTLKVLDIEHSRQVRNDSIPYILDMSNLENINIFQCDISTRDQTNIITGLRNLIHLYRGDFIGDVADDLATIPRYETFRSLIRDFWASEEYYFHCEEQMLNVVKYFPHIEKMLYMFQPLQSAPMTTLGMFDRLENIDLWGGRFYSDDIVVLLTDIGKRLTKLSLVHAEELDERAIALITSFCPKLRSLGFHNCEFVESTANGYSDEAFHSIDRFQRMYDRASLRKELLTPLLELKIVKIVSACPSRMVSWILEPCLNVEQINIGLNTEFDDACIYETLTRNRLSRLKKLNVQKCKSVTMKGVTALIENCADLIYLKDLYYFEGISDEEMSSLLAFIKRHNLNLDVTNESCAEPFKQFNFMKSSLKDKFPSLDNSPEWDTSGS